MATRAGPIEPFNAGEDSAIDSSSDPLLPAVNDLVSRMRKLFSDLVTAETIIWFGLSAATTS
jgi:hypothetical protein